jgi:hypothetical protein
LVQETDVQGENCMSADVFTDIMLKGSHEELIRILRVIKDFKDDKTKKARLHSIYIVDGAENINLNNISQQELRQYITHEGNGIEIKADGPYGVYKNLLDVGLFQTMAEAANRAYFKGESLFSRDDEEEQLRAEFIEGKLYIENFCIDVDVATEWNKKKLTKRWFGKLFGYKDDAICDRLYEAFLYCVFYELNHYSDFIDYCEEYGIYYEIEEDRFEAVIKELEQFNLCNLSNFGNIDDYATKVLVYDPIRKKYL